MKRAVLILSILLAVELSVLVMPTVAANEHSRVTAKGWAFVRTAPRQGVRGGATLWVFATVPDHCELPIHIHLMVGEKEFWWVIDENSIKVCRNIVKLKAEPAHGFGAPSPITVIAKHQKHWWIIAFGKGVFFYGRATCQT